MIDGVFLVALIFGQPVSVAGPMTFAACRHAGAEALATVGEVFADPVRAAGMPRFHGERLRKGDVAFGCSDQRPTIKTRRSDIRRDVRRVRSPFVP